MSSVPAENPQELQQQMQVARSALADDAQRIADSTSALRAGWQALKSQAHLIAACGLAATAGYLLAPRRKRREPRLALPSIEIKPQITSSLVNIARGAAVDFMLRTALDYVSRQSAPAARDFEFSDASTASSAAAAGDDISPYCEKP